MVLGKMCLASACRTLIFLISLPLTPRSTVVLATVVLREEIDTINNNNVRIETMLQYYGLQCTLCAHTAIVAVPLVNKSPGVIGNISFV